MAGQPIADLAVRIGADTSDLKRGLSQAETGMQKLARVGAAAGLQLAQAVAVAVTAVAALAAKGIALGDSMATTAQRLNLTVTEVGGLHHVARMANVEFGTLEAGAVKLGIAVSKAADGSKAQAEALHALGLSAKELQRLSLSEQMLRVGDALSTVKDQTDQLRIAQDMFGRGAGAQFVGMFRQGSGAIREQFEEAQKLGLYLDGAQTQIVKAAADSQDRLKSAFEGLTLQMGARLAPAFKIVSDWLTTLVSRARDAIAVMHALDERVLGIVTSSQNMSDTSLSYVLEDEYKRLFELENQIAERRRTMSEEQLAMDGTHQAQLQQQADLQLLINDRLAERVKRSQAAEAPTGGTGLVDEDGDNETLAAAQAAAAAELELVTAVYAEKERLALEEITKNAEYAVMMYEAAEEFHALELEQEQTWAAVLAEERERAANMELEGVIRHEGLLTQAKREGEEARAALTKKTAGEQARNVFASLEQITSVVAQHSKKAFEINKLAAIANATIEMAQGIARGVGLGFPAGIPAVAWAAANGAAQIAAIKNTSFQGGGAGTTPSAAATPVVNSAPVAQLPRRLHVEGIVAGSLFDDRTVRDLARKLLEYQRDGGEIVLQ